MTNFIKALLGTLILGLLAVSPAGAATTFGNTTYVAAGTFQCNNRLTVSEMLESQAPTPGVITSFTINPNAAGGTASFKVVNLDPVTHKVLVTGTSGQFPISTPGTQSKPTRVRVVAGQYIGVWGTANFNCVTDVMSGQGNVTYFDVPDPAVGFNGTVTGTYANERPLLSATIEPDADNDGFGDETQDGCPANPTRQTPPCVDAPVTIPVKTCRVPSVKAKTKTAAKKAIEAAGCKLGKAKSKKLKKFTKKQKKNRVRSQSPAAGQTVAAGSSVTVTINTKKN